MLTFVKSVHVQLPHKRRDVGVLEILAVGPQRQSHQSMIPDDLRKNFGEVGRGGHDKGFVVIRPSDQILYARILQHATHVSARAAWDVRCDSYL